MYWNDKHNGIEDCLGFTKEHGQWIESEVRRVFLSMRGGCTKADFFARLAPLVTTPEEGFLVGNYAEFLFMMNQPDNQLIINAATEAAYTSHSQS